ncbi:MAG: helix-turn-helix transcriptional regulator [Opitutaceae bacterium]|jgi:AraC family cel operon transcriptional repressor|nr:helix-turn-helix transcriptional regulator [Opitutaceae bacterium]
MTKNYGGLMRFLDISSLPPGEVCTFARWTYVNPDEDRGEVHSHRFHELFWVESGEGVEWVNGTRRELRPGLLVLVRAEDAHAFSSARKREGGGGGARGGKVCFVNFAFSRDCWRRVRERGAGLAGNYFDRPRFGDRAHLLSTDEMERLRVMSHDLQAGSRDAFTADTFLAGVIALLENRDKKRPASSLPEWLATACEQIRLYPHFNDGTSAFIRLAGRSHEHVSREIRRHLGITPTELVGRARLDHVARLLTTTSRDILDIAYEAGFENMGHFYERFRAFFKTTPRRYRLENTCPASTVGARARADQ